MLFGDKSSLHSEGASQPGNDPSAAGTCQGSQESLPVCKKLHPEKGKGLMEESGASKSQDSEWPRG